MGLWNEVSVNARDLVRLCYNAQDEASTVSSRKTCLPPCYLGVLDAFRLMGLSYRRRRQRAAFW